MAEFIELPAFYKHVPEAEAPAPGSIGHFNIFRIEDILLPKYKRVTYSRRSFYKVSLITGHNKIHHADKTVEFRESALVFTNPTIPYLWERIGEEQKGYFCIFTEPFFKGFENSKDYPVFRLADAAVLPLTATEATPFEALFSRMFRELQGNYLYKYDLLRNLLMEVVHEAQKMQPAAADISAGSNASERITAMFAELLERQFPIELSYQVVQLSSPSTFARQLNIHVNHLNKALKETTGQTTSQLISARLLQEARVLLKSTHWTIAQVAWSLGFEEPNHFSSFFKNKEKVTPQQFRQSAID